jgi:hypothetical protein
MLLYVMCAIGIGLGTQPLGMHVYTWSHTPYLTRDTVPQASSATLQTGGRFHVYRATSCTITTSPPHVRGYGAGVCMRATILAKSCGFTHLITTSPPHVGGYWCQWGGFRRLWYWDLHAGHHLGNHSRVGTYTLFRRPMGLGAACWYPPE